MEPQTALKEQDWDRVTGEKSVIYTPCTVSNAFSVQTHLILIILSYKSVSPLPPVPRKSHFTKQETDIERLRIFPRVIAKVFLRRV